MALGYHPPLSLVSATLTVVLVLAGCSSSGTAGKTGYDQPSTPPRAAAGHSGGLSITLKATPGSVRTGEPVRFTLTADERHAFGALGYRLLYGDGNSSANVVPMSCLAGMGVRDRQTWHFVHSYRTTGRYVVSARVYANCSADHTTVTVNVKVA